MNDGTSAKPRHRKRSLFSIACGSFLYGVCACAFLRPGAHPRNPESGRVDSLNVLKETIASVNFLRAVNMLSPSDRSPLLRPAGDVREEFKPRLRAIRLRTLAEDPKVRLRRGKLEGITSGLPAAGPGDALAAGIDTNRWEGLSLREGRLVGVMPLPSRAPGRYGSHLNTLGKGPAIL